VAAARYKVYDCFADKYLHNFFMGMSYHIKMKAEKKFKNNTGGKMKRRLVYSLGVLIVLALMAFTGNTYAIMNSGGNMGTPGGAGGTVPSSGMMSTMAMPTSQMMFSSGPTTDPVIGSGPQDTMPMGVGSVAVGGDMLTIHAEVGQFQMPMDMYFALYAPSVDPFNIYLMNQEGDLQPVSMGMSPWITGVTSIDQMPFGANIPTSMFPKGTYSLGLMATPAGSNMASYYLWMTNFVIQ
jgi:hypothetical protein